MNPSTESSAGYTSLRLRERPWLNNYLKIVSMLLFVIAGFFIAATIVLSVLYINERNKTTTVSAVHDNDVCLTRYCIKAGNHFLESIDETVDPCEDFYQFTCGTWIKNTNIPKEVTRQSVFRHMNTKMLEIIIDLLLQEPAHGTVEPKAITNARRLYTTCVDEYSIEEEGFDAVLALINKEFGGWPILQGTAWNSSAFNFSHLWLKLSQYDSSVFYHIETEIDEDNPTIASIRIRPRPPRERYRIFSRTQVSFLVTYQQAMRNIALALTNNTSMIDTDVNDTLNFEEKISDINNYKSAIYSFTNKHTYATPTNLSQTMNSTFDFITLLRCFYLLANVTVTKDDTIKISQIDFLRNISLVVARESPRILQNYMIWHFIMAQVSNIPKRFQTLLYQNETDILGVADEGSREMTCASYVIENMPFAVSKLYIKNHFDKVARIKAWEIVDDIRKTFIHMVNQSTWMDSLSKEHTIEKAQAMIEKVGYPDYLEDDDVTELENIYAEHDFSSSHMQNLLLLLKLNLKRNHQFLRRLSVARDLFPIPPTTVGAGYDRRFNKIVIPVGLLQPPVFSKDVPNYLNYGAIGVVVGHEITHGFDELHRHMDKSGRKYTLWSNETIERYDKRSECIVEQYRNYTISQIKDQVNGERTRDENIADNDGLKKAFYAYQKWIDTHKAVEKKLPGLTKYSAEQMFFISFGRLWCSKVTNAYQRILLDDDEHSPPQFRTNGPTSNFPEFDRVFSCKPGQGNSRVNKCSVW